MINFVFVVGLVIYVREVYIYNTKGYVQGVPPTEEQYNHLIFRINCLTVYPFFYEIIQLLSIGFGAYMSDHKNFNH